MITTDNDETYDIYDSFYSDKNSVQTLAYPGLGYSYKEASIAQYA